MSSTPVDMTGQVVIVTGSGRGLGREYALQFAQRGANVVINDIGLDEDGRPRADSVVAEIEALGTQAISSGDNIMTSDGATALVESAIERWGRIDALVNNAGFLRPGFLPDLTDDMIESVIAVHLTSSFFTTRAAWSRMVERGYGRVVLTSSASSFGHSGNSQYAAAKGGLIGMARSLKEEARELSADFDFRINCVLPNAQSVIAVDNPLPGKGMEETREIMNQMKPRRTPRSVAPLVVYLASRECAVNGEAFSANVGRFARVLYGVTPGWLASSANEVTVEDIQDHLDEILNPEDATIPDTMREETVGVYERLVAADLL